MKPLPKKYVMTAKKIILVDGTILYQIKAVRNFGSVKKGELGGFIENDRNLSHEGTCWVKGNAKVFGNAKVYENAVISSGSAVCGDSQIYGNAHVCERSLICGHATICDSAQIHGAAVVCMNARISDSAEVSGRALIYWDAEICGNSRVCGGIIGDSARISNSRDYAVVGPVGLYSEQLTFYRTKDGNIHVIFNVSDRCSTPLETFKRDISKKDTLSWGDSNKYRDEYMNAIKYVEAVMATTQPMERNVVR